MNFKNDSTSGDRLPITEGERLMIRLKKALREWQALPKPRPDYLEWLADVFSPDISNALLKCALVGSTESHRQWAIRTFLEFTKSKPKQSLEVATLSQEPAAPQELMSVFSQVFGIPVAKLERMIKPN